MKAISISQPGKVETVEIAEPALGAEDVLLEVQYIGLCGSDLNTWRGTSPMVTYPRIPGHEVSGHVADKGAAVPSAIHDGARVMVSPYTNCNLCSACRAGRPNCCQFNKTLGVQRDGALTRRIAIHYSKVFASDVLSFEELALAEPLSVGYHAANRGRVTETDTVLVLGCGTIGLGAVAAAARKGAQVIVADIDDEKLAMAKKFGARHGVNSAKEDLKARIAELTGGEGVSVAIEAIGLPLTFRLAVELTAFAGRVVYIGYAKDEVAYDTKKIVQKELDIMGSRNALLVFPVVIKMLEERRMPFKDLITRVYPFDHTAQAFSDWNADPGKVTKYLVDVNK
ncbi:MAG: zinc-binding alcohol dehydrogenase family protein [Candidatus Sumerlaeota bacterium]|nr:zinc-binding alcohol dehydrogenase family protein [Candidatus Sumerlaeota bacterium]